jgi:hypothetical protein
MAVWDRTKAELQRHIETSVRSARGNVAIITAEDRFSIFGAINEAIIDMSLERGIDIPKPILSDTSVDTVANQNYVDLAAGVIQVMDGTVRIEAEDQILSPMSISAFYAIDPGEDVTASFPTRYAIDTNGSGNMRLLLRDTPDSVKTIDFKAQTMPDEDSISSFPGWYHGMLRSLATSIALESLGLPVGTHQQRYNERLKNIREKQRGRDGPEHLQLRERTARPVAPELRISGSI